MKWAHLDSKVMDVPVKNIYVFLNTNKYRGLYRQLSRKSE